MAKIIKQEYTKRTYIHNDLANGAFYFKDKVEKHLQDPEERVAFDCMAFLVLAAFAFEARLNFIGAKKITNWKERAPFMKKVDCVFSKLGIITDWDERPFSTVNKIKDLRDMLAHGKPSEEKVNKEVIIKQQDPKPIPDLSAYWHAYCTPEFVQRVHKDMESVWASLLEKAGIEPINTMTRIFGSNTFVKNIDDT